MRYLIVLVVVWTLEIGHAQEGSKEELIRLYKQNYIEWISSPEISRMLARDPELNAIIEEIPIMETEAFKAALNKKKQNEEGHFDITELLGEGAMDVSMDIIKELVSTDNTEVIINMYWNVLKSAESQEIVDLIMPHVMKAREEFERAGVEMARTIRY